LPWGDRARMLRVTPGCRRLSAYGGSGGRGACHQHISHHRQNLHQEFTFRLLNVRRSPSGARRGSACVPSPVSSIGIHRRSLVNSSAMRRLATVLRNIERARHNGTPTGPPDAQSRRSWRSIRSCKIMCKTDLPVRSLRRRGRSSSARRLYGTGDGPCIDRAGAGQGPGARNRFLVAFGSTFPRIRRCASVTKRSIRHSMCRAEERCAVNWRPACAPAGYCGRLGHARADQEEASFPPRS